jgi:anti-sigma factor RsiW
MDDTANLTTPELAELSALADGTLDPGRRESVQAWVDASPERTALYERERRAVTLLHATRSERAPAGLKARIEAQREERRAPLFRLRIAYGGGLAGALAAIGLALALILPGGAPGAPSISEAAALAVRGATSPAPTPGPSEPGAQLGQLVGSVYFPDWAKKFGWHATGQRSDHLGGQLADTVYYRAHGETIAYTIVASPALHIPPASHTNLHGTELWTLKLGGRQIVTWRRNGQTCVLSSTSGVPAQVLQRLAAWRAPGGQD